MLKQTLSLILCLGLSVLGFGQDTRSYDGTQNNLTNTTWGAVGEQLPRITSYGYADGISEPGGIGLPNPRVLSNVIFAQDSLLNDPLNLSDFVWVFGQFIDHDITAVGNDATEPIPIPVDFPDEYFNPGGIFTGIEIGMHRSLAAPGSGTGLDNPREHFNNITSWIDASNVYGSSLARANWLRTFSDGKLKTSAGNLLPYNTIDGELGSFIDPNAPFMDNENPFVTKLFVAGDSRANENTLLTAFHTVFVREHNRLCDELKVEHPTWSEEELYQNARRRVGGHIAAIVYEEWLPAMGVSLPDYAGYDASIDPTITNIFSAAAFRLGHTLLNGNLRRMDNEGNNLGDIALKDAFFTPSLLADNGMDVFFIGMAEQVEQDMDAKVVDDVRNFLFGPPLSGIGGLDLAAININRGRERGIPPFNTVRADLGLTPYADLDDFCGNPEICQVLAAHYGNINFIDAWVGMLLEDHMPGMLFGETILAIMMQQFGDLRDGDRFYYEDDSELSGVIEEIKETTFRDIIMRNTGVTIMQDNVFEAMPHDSICMADGDLSEINGLIQTWNGLNSANVEVVATNVEDASEVTANTVNNGGFLLENAHSCEHYIVTPSKNTNHVNGVTTNDLIKIIKHILVTETLDSPYKIIGADANNDGNITVSDVVDLRKLILLIDTTLGNNTSWRFVDADYVFDDPTDPLEENFPEHKDISSVDETTGLLNFVAIKIGDMNGSANPDLFDGGDGETRTNDALIFETNDRKIKAGDIVQLPIRSQNIMDVNGFQFTLGIDKSALAFDGVFQQKLPGLSATNFNHLPHEGLILGSWNGNTTDLNAVDVLFTFQFEALKDGQLSDYVQLNSNKILAEAYNKTVNNEIWNVALRFEENATTAPSTFVLHQNQPNPFRNNTVIGFELPGDSEVTLTIMDVTGRLIQSSTDQYGKGYQQIELDPSSFSQSGSVFYYQMETEFGTDTKKMIIVK